MVFDSQIVIGREMTKHFEEFITGTAAEILQKKNGLTEKGEFAVAIYNTEIKREKKNKFA